MEHWNNCGDIISPESLHYLDSILLHIDEAVSCNLNVRPVADRKSLIFHIWAFGLDLSPYVMQIFSRYSQVQSSSRNKATMYKPC